MTFSNLELIYEFVHGMHNLRERLFIKYVCVCVSNFIHTQHLQISHMYIHQYLIVGSVMKICNLVGPNDASLTVGLVDSVYKDAREACETCITKKMILAAALKKFEGKDK